MLDFQALSFYSVEPLYDSLCETYQMFCFSMQFLQNKTVEKPRMKVQLSRKIRLQANFLYCLPYVFHIFCSYFSICHEFLLFQSVLPKVELYEKVICKSSKY